MGKIKRAGVYAGIAIGGVIGGAVSLTGKLTGKKFIEDLGGNIMDSTILTGEIVGEAVSGATRVVSGKLTKKPRRIQKGQREMKQATGKVVSNITDNFKTIKNNSGEIIQGVKHRDPARVKNGAKTLGKVIAISLVTVGAVKLDETEINPNSGTAAEPTPKGTPNPDPEKNE